MIRYVGTVPIFLGDAAHLKTLIPHPKSVIFMADYNDNVTALVDYLKYLVSNETAYEEHRNWRKDFSYQQNIKDKPLLEHSWHCRICQWALSAQTKDPNRFDSCPAPEEIHNKNKNLIKAPVEWNGKAVRGGNRQIYLVKDGVLYPVPDLATFNSLNLQLESVMVVSNHEIAKYLVGEALPRAE